MRGGLEEADGWQIPAVCVAILGGEDKVNQLLAWVECGGLSVIDT